MGLVLSASPFPVWLVFYVIGVLKAQGLHLPMQNRFPLVWALLGIVLSCLQIICIHSYNGNFAQGIKFGTHVYTYFFLMWLFSFKAQRIYTKIQNCKFVFHLVVLGRLSFFVYLTHCLIISVMNMTHLPDWWIFTDVWIYRFYKPY